MKIFKIIGQLILFILLTVFTQVGGVVYLLNLFLVKKIKPSIQNKYLKSATPIFLFFTLYLITSFFIVTPIASAFGKVRLPMFEQHNLKPANIMTCLMNRNFVRKELKTALEKACNELQLKYPGTTIYYLDGTFPLFSKFPLFPHFSHRDGRKLDLTFFYKSKSTGQAINTTPSWWGYGVCEGPQIGETNMPETCAQKGHWQYSIIENITPQGRKRDLIFDAERTKYFIELLDKQTEIKRMFIEPHLKERMQLKCNKIVFHGCHAVRHDDHLHIEMIKK